MTTSAADLIERRAYFDGAWPGWRGSWRRSARKLGFTGSTDVGKLRMAQCARQVEKVSLELGGNAAFIVFDDRLETKYLRMGGI